MNDNSMLTALDGAIPTLKRVGTLYWNSGTVRLFFQLALLFVVPATAIVLALVYAIVHHRDANGSFQEFFWYYVTILGSKSLVQASLVAMAEGAISVAVASLYLQRHPRWLLCLKKAFTKLCVLFFTGILAEFFVLVGFSFFFIPGLLLKINFIVTTPVIVLENETFIFSSLLRSWNLTKGYRWYIFKCILSLDLLYWLTSFFLRLLLKTDDNSKPFLSLTFHLLIAIPNAVFVPAFGILKTVIYIQLMLLKEDLDGEKLANQIHDEEGHVPLLVNEEMELEVSPDPEDPDTKSGDP